MPGFPIFEGSIFPSDFVDWRKKSLSRGIESGHEPNDADKSDESAHLSGSPTALPSKAALVLASCE